MPRIPTYRSVVCRQVAAGFHQIDTHDFAGLTEHYAPDLHHRFAGDHALGGERHDAETSITWLERVARVLPDLRFTIEDTTVAGLPNDTTVVVRWTAEASPADGGAPYRNRGVHVIRLRWAKITAMDVHADTQRVAAALARQAATGVEEAAAAPITS